MTPKKVRAWINESEFKNDQVVYFVYGDKEVAKYYAGFGKILPVEIRVLPRPKDAHKRGTKK